MFSEKAGNHSGFFYSQYVEKMVVILAYFLISLHLVKDKFTLEGEPCIPFKPLKTQTQ